MQILTVENEWAKFHVSSCFHWLRNVMCSVAAIYIAAEC